MRPRCLLEFISPLLFRMGVDSTLCWFVAGVSALRPLLEIAGVTRDGKKFNPQDCTLSGLQDGVRIAHAAMQGNYVGPLVAALTFVSHTF